MPFLIQKGDGYKLCDRNIAMYTICVITVLFRGLADFHNEVCLVLVSICFALVCCHGDLFKGDHQGRGET